MKVTLIYPLLSKHRSRVDENKQYWPPLGLAYIAAVLRCNSHRVQILDRDYILHKNNFDFKKTDDITLGLIEEFDTDVVGLSATTPNISDVRSFSEKIKMMNPKTTTVIGGPHCIGEPIATLEMCSGIDLLVRGEGEMIMLDIANGLDLPEIEGLVYRMKGGTIVSNLDRPLIESLDSLPLPARDLLDMGFYTRPSRYISRNLSLRTTHIFTARGCPYNCYYCAGPLMGRRKVRYHSAQRVTLEVEDLINKYSIEAIYFAEDMFLSNKKRALEMIELFIKRNIHKKIVWMAQLSTNAVDEELLSKMREGGCIHVEYGFESGSQGVLNLMNKKADIEHNKKIAMLTKKSKLRFQGNFIVGYPGETEEDFNKTMSFIKETRPNNVSLNIFMPLPGTQIYKRLKQEGRLICNWDDIGNIEVPQMNYADMPPSRFEELYFKAKLKVILPMNLFYFVKDNLCHPYRLFYVISTQFRSVISRAFRAFLQLHKINKETKQALRVLFIAYHPISYPIMESQALSYIRVLSKKNVKYSLLTFETKESFENLQASSIEFKKAFKWRHLYYHRKPRFLATLLDIITGICISSFIIKKDRIKIIHARGLIPAVIAFLPAKIFNVKSFFDTRGLLAEKYVGGGLLKKSSLIYKLMRWGEDLLINKSNCFTVETIKHAKIIKDKKNGIEKKMEVIPCCVDMDKFNYLLYNKNGQAKNEKSGFNLVYLGKIGTWYLLDEMLDFFCIFTKEITNAYFTFVTQDEPTQIYLAAKQRNIPKSQIIVNKLNSNEIPALLAMADAGIFFINSYNRYNSSPIKYGEYLACGLPVVINSGIGDTDIITEREKVGVVIRNFSSLDYKIAAQELINLTDDKDDLRQRCRAVAEKYLSLEQGANKYLMIYQKLNQ